MCSSCNKPYTVPPVRRSDGTSRYNKRLDRIPLTLKVLADRLDDMPLTHLSLLVTLSEYRGLACHWSLLAGLYHREDSSNILTDNPRGPDLPYRPQHLRPEVAVILRSSPSSCHREGLAGKAPGKDIDPSPPLRKVCCPDVSIMFRFREMIPEHPRAEAVYLAVERVAPAHPPRGEVEAAHSAEEAPVRHSAALPFSLSDL